MKLCWDWTLWHRYVHKQHSFINSTKWQNTGNSLWIKNVSWFLLNNKHWNVRRGRHLVVIMHYYTQTGLMKIDYSNTVEDDWGLSLQFLVYGSYYAIISVLFLIRGTYTACKNQCKPEPIETMEQESSVEVIFAERFWPRSTDCLCCLDNTTWEGDQSICLRGIKQSYFNSGGSRLF